MYALNTFHFHCFRSILGVYWKDQVPNLGVLLERTGSSDLYTTLHERHLRWTGHIYQMNDSRLPKILLYGELANAPHKHGRPHLRFKDVIKRDLQAFSINLDNWEALANDRTKWRTAINNGRRDSQEAYK